MDKLFGFITIIAVICLLTGSKNLYGEELSDQTPPNNSFKTVRVDDSTKKTILGPYLYLLEDTKSVWSITDVSSEDFRESFLPNREKVVNLGYTESVYWARITVESRCEREKEWFIVLEFSLMDRISFYSPGKNNTFIEKKTGYLLPFSSREIKHRYFIFPVVLKPGTTKTYYFRFENQDRMSLPLTLYSKESFYSSDRLDQYLLGLFYGLIFIMIAYNLLLYFSLRDKTYLYYVLFLVTFCIYLLTQNGLAYEYYWPDALHEYNHYITYVLSVSLFFGIQFGQSFLNTGKNTPVINRLLTVMKICVIIPCAIAFFGNYRLSREVIIFICLLSILNMIAAGTISVLKRYRPAYFFMIAMGSFLATAIVFGLKSLGVFPVNWFTGNSIFIGSSLIVTLLSLGLGDRINTLRKEKETVQVESIRNLREADKVKDQLLNDITEKNRKIENLNRELKQKIVDLNDANSKISLSEERYRVLVEGSSEIIFSLDEGFRIVTINQSVQKIMNVKPESIMGKSIFELLYRGGKGSDISVQLIKEKLDAFMRDREPVTFKAEFRSPISSEPKEMMVNLEFINMKGKNEILGKAFNISEDILLSFFHSEKQRFILSNSLIAAEEITYRLTKNINRYCDAKKINALRIGLREVIINAIEHGNLEISFEEKSRALVEGVYFSILGSRRLDPRFRDRTVSIDYSLDFREVRYVVSDEGQGFDWRTFFAQNFEKQNSELILHGRGIMLCRDAFDEMSYNDKGNEVTLVKKFVENADSEANTGS